MFQDILANPMRLGDAKIHLCNNGLQREDPRYTLDRRFQSLEWTIFHFKNSTAKTWYAQHKEELLDYLKICYDTSIGIPNFLRDSTTAEGQIVPKRLPVNLIIQHAPIDFLAEFAIQFDKTPKRKRGENINLGLGNLVDKSEVTIMNVQGLSGMFFEQPYPKILRLPKVWYKKTEEKKSWGYIKNLFLESFFGTWKIRSIRKKLQISIWTVLLGKDLVVRSRKWHNDSVFMKKNYIYFQEEGIVKLEQDQEYTVVIGEYYYYYQKDLYAKVSLHAYLHYLHNTFTLQQKTKALTVIQKSLHNYIAKHRQKKKWNSYLVIHYVSKKITCKYLWKYIFSFIGGEYNYYKDYFAKNVKKRWNIINPPRLIFPVYTPYTLRPLAKINEEVLYTHECDYHYFGATFRSFSNDIHYYIGKRAYEIKIFDRSEMGVAMYADDDDWYEERKETGYFFGNLSVLFMSTYAGDLLEQGKTFTRYKEMKTGATLGSLRRNRFRIIGNFHTGVEIQEEY